jgi:antitoxin HicB
MKTDTVLDAAKSVAHYIALPYTTVLRRDDEGDIVAHIEELPGCVAHGQDSHEALTILEEFKQAWIERCIAAGNPVPEPQIEEPLPSGKWLQRVPRTLHKKLVRIAKREDVSLNQLVTSMLSEAVAVKTWEEAMKRCKVQFPDTTFTT